MILSILTPFFAFFTEFCLFPPLNTLLSCYYYQIFCLYVVAIQVLSLWHQDMGAKINWVFLVSWISTIFLPILGIFSVYSSCFYPDVCCLIHTTHHYLSHWTCNYTYIASNNFILCMSCYYCSHLIIPYLAQILGFWVTWEVKWCHYVMVEAGSHLKLLPTSILDIYKVFEHIDMLSMGIQYQSYTVISTLHGSDSGVLGHLWSRNDAIMSRLRLTATSYCFPHPY